MQISAKHPSSMVANIFLIAYRLSGDMLVQETEAEGLFKKRTCMLVSLLAPLLLSAFRESSRLFRCSSFSASLSKEVKIFIYTRSQ